MSKDPVIYKDAKSPCPRCGQRRFIVLGIKRPRKFHIGKCSVVRTRKINELRKDLGLELLVIPKRNKKDTK